MPPVNIYELKDYAVFLGNFRLQNALKIDRASFSIQWDVIQCMNYEFKCVNSSV